MADAKILLGYKDSAWFTANASIVLLEGQVVFLKNDSYGRYKIGNGVTALSALPFSADWILLALDTKANNSHVHELDEVNGLEDALAGKADTAHDHELNEVSGLQTALDGKAANSHSHAIADVTGLQTALDGKAASAHNHAISDVTGLQTALDGKAASSHSHAISDVTGLQAALEEKANKTALFDPRNRTEWVEEFMTGGSETGEIGSHNWEAISASSGTTTAQAATAGHPGVYRISCGTTSAAGRSALYCGQSVLQLGGGSIEVEMGINIGQVPDGTNTFTIEAGLGDTPSGTTTDGVYFYFDRAVSTTNWLARAVSNSVGNNTDTGVALATGWVSLKIVIDANATEVKYYINGTLVATVTGDIPSAAGRSCAPQFKVTGSAGTGANRYIDADYFKFCQLFTTPR